jgi:FKBP-type peptidyl-prolyl cis-trans isomerase SlpA
MPFGYKANNLHLTKAKHQTKHPQQSKGQRKLRVTDESNNPSRATASNAKTDQNTVVALGCKVDLHFALKLEEGAIIDSTFEKAPASLTLGDGNLPEHFEACLLGLTQGDHQTFVLTPEQAFGQHNPQNIQRVSRSQFDDSLELSEGLVVSFQDAAGKELPGVIVHVDDQDVRVDFNHPLAGKTLRFEVNILAVEPKVVK